MEKQKLLYQQARLHDRGAAEMVLQTVSASKGEPPRAPHSPLPPARALPLPHPASAPGAPGVSLRTRTPLVPEILIPG